ncbi:TetR/AcrR family transcriptional regulator [Marinibaculum pumilum]|uniref:TetR/AcrR family transcriptional regulator n=1 Tax=Marinibaculum pumilum TaxID=1766165 RepID=A0ABV7L097_9PROT
MGDKATGEERSLRERILDAALEILQDSGIKKLTQPKVAAAAGIRQSHLTYYFPKKIDLVTALLQGHLDHAGAHGPAHDIMPALRMIATDRRRIRFFLGLVIEAEQQPALRPLVYRHMEQFDALVAAHFGRPAGDPDVQAFLDALRGAGMKQLLRESPAAVDVEALAGRFGLRPAPPQG